MKNKLLMEVEELIAIGFSRINKRKNK